MKKENEQPSVEDEPSYVIFMGDDEGDSTWFWVAAMALWMAVASLIGSVYQVI